MSITAIPRSTSLVRLFAALAYCVANGAPPAAYFVVGDGPVVGPKQ